METKKIVFIECEKCGTSVDSEHAQHFEDDFVHTEMDLCDDCYDKVCDELEAQYA